MTLPRVLTIAGSDSGGGAGIQADLKTFQELDTFGMSALTALTAQNTVGVHGVHEVPPDFVRAQIDAVVGDIGVDAVKTGMLSSAAIVEAVADYLRVHPWAPLVVDPVCASKHGAPLLRPAAVAALRQQILPLATVVTPNLGEVKILTGVEVSSPADLLAAAEAVFALMRPGTQGPSSAPGPQWVLVKGGHLEGAEAVDLLFDGQQEVLVTAPRSPTTDTHGTGCTLASAIAAYLALGQDIEGAVRAAKAYVTGAIEHGLRLGAGIGPVDHGWRRHG
ncbi:MAG: bifunctional hydroxymethylpyrimidine kinase/phosphomethylpyrimidine kinase [Euzebyaceae bacterium]|jgi:hydroxymethylpyrimidine/phosphomethylpyrimidine kinase|nr:bifunctional hydroxymethylpyrimidine kinase/phosphomethylpyrimidine kinase [Euzebyaceae bacterium]